MNAARKIQLRKELVRFPYVAIVGRELFIHGRGRLCIPGPDITVLPGQEELLRVTAHVS